MLCRFECGPLILSVLLNWRRFLIGVISIYWTGVLLLSLLAVTPSAFAAPADAETVDRCSTILSMDFLTVQDAPARIVTAEQVSLAGETPAHCVVNGYVAPQVGFELKLPLSGWNGKLVAVGNAGWGGRVNSNSCDRHVRRGYACVASDTGHRGGGSDGLWAANNLAAQVDFGYRSVHVMALAAKAIVSRFYSKEISRSYFVGCSTGGYEGLVEAQRFPWDFDGIIAGAPDMDEADLTMRELWESRNSIDARGQPLFTDAQLRLLHESVLALCDRDDGVMDGVVGNPLACRFDPARLLCKGVDEKGIREKVCLMPNQVEAVRRIYAGPPVPEGQSMIRGALPGSELGWGALGGIGPKLGDGLFRYMIYGASPEWTPANYDFEHDYKRLGMGAFYTDTNPDLRRFKTAGGKLLVYQGWNDVVEMPTAIVDYYETAERTMGGRSSTQSFFRLFMVPGMNHCGGGVGAYSIDYMQYLESWVEEGKVPDRLLGGHLSEAYLATLPETTEVPIPDLLHQDSHHTEVPITFTRPVYPYPIYARYAGSGDPADAANFRPAEPRSGCSANSRSLDCQEQQGAFGQYTRGTHAVAQK